MRLLKKILRIIAILLPVFCCAFISVGDSHALEYQINRIPAWHLRSQYGSTLYDPLTISFAYLDLPSGFSLKQQKIVKLQLVDSKCAYDSAPTFGHYNSPEYSYNFAFYQNYVSDFPDSYCNNKSIFPLSNSNFSSSGLPVEYTPLINKGYSFDYAYFDAKSQVDLDGQHYGNYLSAKELWSVAPSKFRSLSIPFEGYNLDYSNISHLEFKGSFAFNGSFTWADNIDTTGLFRLQYKYNSNDPSHSVRSGLSTCSITRTIVGSATNLSYSCPLDIPNDLDGSNIGFNLIIQNTSTEGDRFVWDTDSDWSFNALYVISDYDDSPGGEFVGPQLGSNPDQAPGYANPSNSEVNWFTSLTNMFNFSIINPFTVLYNSFTDSNECSHIPIIAGMLHAESDVYCPWFPNSVRQVLTPVISISATMLLFGFFISFLKSSSGNDTIDSGGHGSIFRGRLK